MRGHISFNLGGPVAPTTKKGRTRNLRRTTGKPPPIDPLSAATAGTRPRSACRWRPPLPGVPGSGARPEPDVLNATGPPFSTHTGALGLGSVCSIFPSEPIQTTESSVSTTIWSPTTPASRAPPIESDFVAPSLRVQVSFPSASNERRTLVLHSDTACPLSMVTEQPRHDDVVVEAQHARHHQIPQLRRSSELAAFNRVPKGRVLPDAGHPSIPACQPDRQKRSTFGERSTFLGSGRNNPRHRRMQPAVRNATTSRSILTFSPDRFEANLIQTNVRCQFLKSTY